MKRNWLKFTAALFVGALIFTACETEVTLTAPPDATIDLGESFDEKAGLIVDGAKAEDVLVLWNPAFNNELVDHYVGTYTVEGVSDSRNVYVKSNLLAGPYSVSDAIAGGPTLTYNVTVTQSTQEFNRLLIDGFNDFNIQVYALVNGNAITIPTQTPTNWNAGAGENVQGTGTYDGANKRLTSFTYTINYLEGGSIVTDTGTATYTKQ
jgi:hypothetical protein